MRRLLSIVLAVSCAVPMWAPVARADDGNTVPADPTSQTSAQQAAREIADARERANAAADDYFRSESRVDSLSLEVKALNLDVQNLQAQIDELAEAVTNVAIERYTSTGTDGAPVLTGFEAPANQVQKEALVAVANDTADDDFDRYDALNNDLIDKKAELKRKQEEAEAESRNLATLREQANAEVERLKDVEAQRLKDDAVRRALEAEEKERARQQMLDQQAKQQSAVSTTTIANESDAEDGGSDGGGAAIGRDGVGSGGTGAGQTGGGGAGGRPGGGGGVDYGGVDWLCPTGDAPVAFGDTWGAPRSGGRRHQGVDMIGTRGTPILAVVDGFAKDKTNTLGGFTVGLTGADGNYYYYGHMDSWGLSGPVQRGDVIGYMGDTGNAKFSVVHLHFEVHPGGGAAVNPYPTVRAHC